MATDANKRSARRRILIFRIGSIGDFIVALPCLHLIRNSFPEAEIGLMTNRSVDAKSLPASDILSGTGLVDVYFDYPGGTRAPSDLWRVRQAIRGFHPDCLIHLGPRPELFAVLRDCAFFRLCGVSAIVAPTASTLRRESPASADLLWEGEAHRLARTLARIGSVDVSRPANWNLHLSEDEIAEADSLLAALTSGEAAAFIAIGVGTKQAINDWGPDNWHSVMKGLAAAEAGAPGRAPLGFVAVGGAQDAIRSQALLDIWPGATLNLCGATSPRVSAAVLRRALMFLCHDSGPMHLASTVGTPCVAVFSRHNRPGEWYPFGGQHKIVYPAWRNGGIDAVRPRQVLAAACEMLVSLGAGPGILARVA